MKTIHLVSGISRKGVVRAVLKHYEIKDSVRVCKPGDKPFWSEDDTLVVWHGGDTASIVLFYYLSKVVSGTLFEVDYSHVDKIAEYGYSLASIGDEAIVKAGCGKTFSPVPEEKRLEASSNWDRLSEKPLPLYLMGEDGVIRNYPKDYLEDWLLGIAKMCLQGEEKRHVAFIVGTAMGIMIPPNAITDRYYENILYKLADMGRIVITDDKFVLNNEFLQRADISWLIDCPNEWMHYRQWKERTTIWTDISTEQIPT